MTALVNNMFSKSKEEMAELEKGKALKIYLADLTDLKPSEDNPFDVAEESVASLAENIEENGLKQCLTVQKEGMDIFILSGERRYRALKKLTEEGRHYSYNGVDITGKAPVCYQKAMVNQKKVLDMIAANAHRDMTADEKVNVIKATMKALDELVMKGQYQWPEKERKAHVISEKTGIKEHFVKETLAMLNRPQDILCDDDQDSQGNTKPKKKKEVDEDTKAVRKMLNTLKAANKACLTIGDAALAGADPDMQEKIYDQVQLLIGKLEMLQRSSNSPQGQPNGQSTKDDYINEGEEEW